MFSSVAPFCPGERPVLPVGRLAPRQLAGVAAIHGSGLQRSQAESTSSGYADLFGLWIGRKTPVWTRLRTDYPWCWSRLDEGMQLGEASTARRSRRYPTQ